MNDTELTKKTDEKPEAKAAGTGLKKYRCSQKCYWNGALYNEGDTVDIPAADKVPEWFKEVTV